MVRLTGCCLIIGSFSTMSLEGHFDGKWPSQVLSMKMHSAEQHEI